MIKKAFSYILLFYFILHFAFPMGYYLYDDFFTIYSEQEFNWAVFKGFFINFVAVFGTILVINFIPNKQKQIEPKFNHALSFLIITLLILIVGMIQSGGFEGALEGKLHGTLVSYLALFFDSSTALLLFLFYKKNIRWGIVVLICYVALMTVLGSRSAIIIIILAALMLPVFKNQIFLKRKLRRLILVLSFFSPILFYYGTSVRGAVDMDLLFKSIIGRISMVELAAIPIEGKDTGIMDKRLYDEKYGLSNQVQQAFNEISPLDPFQHDINPNQYYRAIFKGANEENAIDKYFSINLTFPTYLYMEFNFFVACILSVLILSSLYYVLVRNKANVIVVMLILLNLYYLLYYFDWVMITSGLFRTLLTVLCITYYEKFMNVMSAVLKLFLTAKISNEKL